MFNNSPMVLNLANRLDFNEEQRPRRVPRRRVTSEPVLPARLPSTGFLQREAERDVPKAMMKQFQRSPSPIQTKELDPMKRLSTSSTSTANDAPSHTHRASSSSSSPTTQHKRLWKEPEPFEVLRAIEKKDIEFLMQVRDKSFPLLLRPTGGVTPFVHAMRIGETHKDMTIILLGAFSRYINHLEEADMSLSQTRANLRALQTNLRYAIDFGLSKSQSDLTASLLQTLIMSEGITFIFRYEKYLSQYKLSGEKWIIDQVRTVGIALRDGTAGKPVHAAGSIVRSFATRQLRDAEMIASVEDYVANATGDLLMMAAWLSASKLIKGEPIPPYYFARDDRVYKVFVEYLDKHSGAIQHSLGRRLRWQLRTLRQILEGRNTTYRSRIMALAKELDEGDGL